jgi:hypothetical protein
MAPKQNRFKLYFIVLLIICAVFPAYAQNISVKSFRELPNDMDARINQPVEDQNGEKCALIKVVTKLDGFAWEGGMLGITNVEKKTGEYWVYLPRGSKKISIKHDQLGILRNYQFPVAIKKATVYEMKLTTADVETVVKPKKIRSAYLVINSHPDSADVYIDEKYQGQTPFSRKVESGEHTYRLEKNLYYPKAGKFEILADEGRKEMEINLDPNYGSLKITSNPEDGMKVFLDGKYTGKKTPATLKKAASGKHEITLKNKWFQPISKYVTVEDNQVTEVNFSMDPIYGEVTLKTNPPANIYINGKKVGFESYQGRLKEGIHSFKAQKKKYKSFSTERKILTGQHYTVDLNLKPKLGRLDITSDPYGAEITLNGKEYGKTPRMIHDLLVGKYQVELEKEGYFLTKDTIFIREGKTAIADIKLADKTEVKVNSVPKRALVYVNEEYKGRTPLTLGLPKERVRITVRKDGYREKSESVKASGGNTKLFFGLRQVKVYTGFNMELEYGPDLGVEFGLFSNRIFVSGSMGTTRNFKFNKPIAFQDVKVNDLDDYEIAGKKAFPDRADQDEETESDYYFTAKLGLQLTWPFPFFIHAGFGGRATQYYKKVYQAKHDYYPTMSSYSEIMRKGDYFTTPVYYVDSYNSLIVGVSVPLFEKMVIGADYWFNTEVGPAFNFSVGYMMREIR